MMIPPNISIELTYNCNHACSFCSCPWLRHSTLYGRELDPKEWITILNALPDKQKRHITFTGGEPLLKKGFSEILEAAAEMEFASVSVFTNGSLLNEDFLTMFSRLGVNLAVSLPGIFSFRRLTHSVIGPRELLEKVRAARMKGIYTSVSIAVTSINRWEIIPTMLVAACYRASALQVGACMPEGRALLHPDLWLSESQFVKLKQTVTFMTRILKVPISFSYEHQCGCYDLEGNVSGQSPPTCRAGVDFLVIGPDGRVRKCLHSPVASDTIFMQFFIKEGGHEQNVI